MKKIIIIAWAVIILLYNWLSAIYWTPGPDNSNLISTENAVPNKPENNANIKYNVPMSLALDDKNHLSCHSVGCFKVKNDELSWVFMDATSFLADVEKVLSNEILNFVHWFNKKQLSIVLRFTNLNVIWIMFLTLSMKVFRYDLNSTTINYIIVVLTYKLYFHLYI